MGIFRSLAGMVRVELTSADVAGALRAINEMGIPVAQVQTSGDLTVRFTVSRRSLKSIKILAQRKGERLQILARKGIFWPILSLRRRPILVGGMALLLGLSLMLPSRVLFIEVEGNDQVPTSLILEAASESGIAFGASRRAVRSEKMKNALLGAVPELQWAGVNTYGCTAVISVRERAAQPQAQEKYTVSSIVAACDGVITSCTVTSGAGLCAVGQAVSKGQVLISGYVDCGQTITATRSEGEIFAQTSHDLTAVTPAECGVRGEIQGQQTNFSLLLGKNRINFYKGSGISDGSCVKMSTKYHLTLPGGYRLPVTLIKETIVRCDVQTQPVEEETAEALLSGFARQYLREHLVALSILDAQEALLDAGGCWRLAGTYACSEMIGREQGEQIGDLHGKTD